MRGIGQQKCCRPLKCDVGPNGQFIERLLNSELHEIIDSPETEGTDCPPQQASKHFELYSVISMDRITLNQRVAVVLPVYNVERYLRECLDSLRSQTYKNFTVFAVDDGAKDDSGAILDEYAENDNRFIVIHKQNLGVSSARNVALEAINKVNNFEFVCFLDPDDYVSPLFMETFVTELSSKNADYGVCSYQSFSMSGKYPIRGQIPKKQPLTNDDIAAQFFHVSRETHKKIKPNSTSSLFLSNRFFRLSRIHSLRFNENLHACEDQDFFIRAIPLLDTGVLVPDVLFFYRRRISSLSNGRNAKITDFAVYENLFRIRKYFSKAVQIGIQTEYIHHLTQELYSKLSGDCSLEEKRIFFNHCLIVSKSSFDFPLNKSAEVKLDRIRLGFVFNYVYAYFREAVRRLRHKRRQAYFFP